MNSRQARILIVEDEAILAYDLCQALEKDGFTVVGPAPSVARALALIRERGCDAAVLDINLRNETSEAAAGELRAHAIPFITVTANSPLSQSAIFASVPSVTKPAPHPCALASQSGGEWHAGGSRPRLADAVHRAEGWRYQAFSIRS